MRKDFDKKMSDLQRQSLKVKGQEFVLDAQIKVLKEQKAKMQAIKEEFVQIHNKEFFDAELLTKETYNAMT